jgi:hypothetical protein
MEAGGMEAIGGMEATGGEAHGWGSASASDRSGGRIGGHTGGHTGADTGDPMPMATPMPTLMAMRTRRWLPPHRPRSISDPHPRRPFSLLHQPRGITVTTHGGITPTCSNVQGDGGQSPPRRHKPEAAGPRAHHPSRVSSALRCDRGVKAGGFWYPPPLCIDCRANLNVWRVS